MKVKCQAGQENQMDGPAIWSFTPTERQDHE